MSNDSKMEKRKSKPISNAEKTEIVANKSTEIGEALSNTEKTEIVANKSANTGESLSNTEKTEIVANKSTELGEALSNTEKTEIVVANKSTEVQKSPLKMYKVAGDKNRPQAKNKEIESTIEQIASEISQNKEEEKWIDRYRIIKELGRGGMGIVYLAEDPKLRRTIALKILLSGKNATEEEKRRFLREAQMAARINHPNIITLYEVGACEEGVYFTMEYFPSRDLRDTIKNEGIKIRNDFRRCASIVEDILDGVSYAHAQGVIHRDLKPGNILISGDKVKITDFGLAREINPEEHLTRSGTFIGTPTYAPPEQVLGRISDINFTSDIYSVGVILYELITGRVPFSSPSPTLLLKKIVGEEPPSPRTIDPKISKDLETICLKAIEKEQHLRYQSALEFKEDLKRFRMGESILAAPPSIGTKILKTIKRYRKFFFVMGTIAICCLLSVIFMAYWSGDVRKEKESRVKTLAEEKKYDEAIALAQTFDKKLVEELEMEKERNRKNTISDYLKQLKEIVNYAKSLRKIMITSETALKNRQTFLNISKKLIDFNKGIDIEERINLEKDIEYCFNNPIDTINLNFINIPKERISKIRAEVYKVFLGSKAISDKPIEFPSISNIELNLNNWYILEFSAQGYASTRIMFEFTPEKRKCDVTLVKSSEIPEGMVYIPRAGDVPHFAIDRYEVTNKRFQEFINDNGYQRKELWAEGWELKERSNINAPNDWDKLKQNHDNPVTGVSWYEAMAYTRWLDYKSTGQIRKSGEQNVISLPTEEQWTIAAYGVDKRHYPWGDNCGKEEEKSYNINQPLRGTLPVTVLSMDQSPYGVIGMGGNVAEWSREEKDNKNPKAIAKGDSWKYPDKYKDAIIYKNRREDWVGFRCVKALPDLKNK